jgi:probable HAF family extracellular repeat protein
MKLSILRVKSFRIVRIGLALALFAGPVWAQEQKPEHLRYAFTDLGALGGTSSMAFYVNAHGAVVGQASVSNGSQHAVLWLKGLKQDLGTLGGNNSVAFSGPSERGQIVGWAETSSSDSNNEDFCGFGTHLTCLAFRWESGPWGHGIMLPLQTLGGNNAEANSTNNRGEVAGSAENSTKDSTCPGQTLAPQILQFKPVIWRKDDIEELPIGNGDPDGVAYWINDDGDAVGTSGTCSAYNFNILANLSPVHALLWHKGSVKNLGSLGGITGNTAFSINNSGEVVGVSDLTGDKTFDAFLWKNDKMHDLHTLPGDVASVALGINDLGDVVGVSIDPTGNLRPVLWHDDKMTDLSTVVPSGSALIPFIAEYINSRGEIVGSAIDPTNFSLHAFKLTPCDDDHCDDGR